MKRGDAVRVASSPAVDPHLHGAPGVVQGFRPDGFVVVQLPNGLRRPFRLDELEPVG